jgi:hypothetical protein
MDTSHLVLRKIVSGAQTGVDRAALDVAVRFGIPCGGWCPADRSAKDGIIPAHYAVTPLPSGGLWKRTKWNVRDSDGTLILACGPLTGGSLLTRDLSLKHQKPHLVTDLTTDPSTSIVLHWLEHCGIQTLNVAGPSESTFPGAYELAFRFLHELLSSNSAACSSQL